MTYVPTDLYEVRLYDHNGNFKLLPQHLVRIEYHQRLNAPWNHQITVEVSKDDDQVTILRAVQDDWITRIFRIDPYTQVRSLVYSGLHVTTVDQAREAGDLIFNFYGSGYSHFLTRRVVVPPANQENSTKSGPAESVIKSFVSDCMISPVDTDRIFPGVSLEVDTGLGETIEYSSRYVNLMTVCENVANMGKLDFGIIEGNTIGSFVFRARPVWGKDKRVGNPEGNRPVEFNFLHGNMDIPILAINASDEKNYIYVGGTGSGEERIIQPVVDAAAVARSPWGRKEFFLEGSQQTETNELIAVGMAELEDRKVVRELTFDIIQNLGYRWLTDWELGDLITARYFDYVADKKIVEVGVAVTAESSSQLVETFTIEMADVRL